MPKNWNTKIFPKEMKIVLGKFKIIKKLIFMIKVGEQLLLIFQSKKDYLPDFCEKNL